MSFYGIGGWFESVKVIIEILSNLVRIIQKPQNRSMNSMLSNNFMPRVIGLRYGYRFNRRYWPRRVNVFEKAIVFHQQLGRAPDFSSQLVEV